MDRVGPPLIFRRLASYKLSNSKFSRFSNQHGYPLAEQYAAVGVAQFDIVIAWPEGEFLGFLNFVSETAVYVDIRILAVCLDLHISKVLRHVLGFVRVRIWIVEEWVKNPNWFNEDYSIPRLLSSGGLRWRGLCGRKRSFLCGWCFRCCRGRRLLCPRSRAYQQRSHRQRQQHLPKRSHNASFLWHSGVAGLANPGLLWSCVPRYWDAPPVALAASVNLCNEMTYLSSNESRHSCNAADLGMAGKGTLSCKWASEIQSLSFSANYSRVRR